ncbi:hypothetical protein EUGRSUZ_E01481 [Eucalyptus grandis]|uniref:Uncharacterized protein n=2 Tax=Eucalyptus grandis TaxID=71139 RepID=A0ACC3KU61_EUCGR|nr:hypothetical protein EUGRSUZ_E01481 [Eucalyptus grandis]
MDAYSKIFRTEVKNLPREIEIIFQSYREMENFTICVIEWPRFLFPFSPFRFYIYALDTHILSLRTLDASLDITTTVNESLS